MRVVVVGGGIVGAACAFELAVRGVGVILLERDRPAAAASGRNHGLLSTPTDPALLPMFRAGLERYEEVAGRAHLPVHLDERPVGFLLAARTGAEASAARDEAVAAAACGVSVERLDAGRARELEPNLAPDVGGAWLFDDVRRVDPAALTVALVRLAGAAGAEARWPVAARALLRSGDRVVGVATDGEALEADAVVIAAGPWSAGLLRSVGLDLPIVPFRGWLVHVAPDRPLVTHLVGGPGLYEPPPRTPVAGTTVGDLAAGGTPPVAFRAIVQPNPDGSLLLGGSKEVAVTPEPAHPDAPARIAAGAVAILPALAGSPVRSSWWGLRPVSPDDRPFVGRLREGLYAATGHGAQGVILGGGTARLLAAQVLDEAYPFDPAPFEPTRFA